MMGTAGNVTPVQGQASFNLRIKNPCIDSDYVIINQTALPVGQKYILHDYKLAGGYKFAHNSFLIVTSPITHSLCGALTYSATFNGSPIDTATKSTNSMAYNTAN